MTYDDFKSFCGGLPGATHVLQWGGAHVWKVGDRVFVIGGWNGDGVGVTFKAGPVAFEVLKTCPACGLHPTWHRAASNGSSITQNPA